MQPKNISIEKCLDIDYELNPKECGCNMFIDSLQLTQTLLPPTLGKLA